MNSKSVPKKLGVLGILITMIVPMLVSSIPVQASPGDYMTVPGVLHDDYYKLYPYKKKSLNIGFSKYGEMIDSDTNVGLEYGDVDPFAPPQGAAVGTIPKIMWLNGWLINITYFHTTMGWRNVWATAQHSDSLAIDGPWLRVDFKGPPANWDPTYGWEDARDPGYDQWNYAAGLQFGGRKTNGTCYTDPINVLYNGPRKFIAVLTTTIHDHPRIQDPVITSDIPLVQLVITIVFDKVKKEVILLKDVKSLVTEKVAASLKVQFSNRGEVDLGTEAVGYHSYFHFYTQGTGPQDAIVEGKSTVYDKMYELFLSEDPVTSPYKGYSASGPYPQAYPSATYDVAQVISTGAKYVFTAAFWPSLNDWSIDGWPLWWRSMDAIDPHWIDADTTRPPYAEPKIPYYIGEWDFVLEAKEFTNIHFRGVTVYGVTDLWDGSDSGKVIDREAKYQLDEVFNPWDLYAAAEKATKRWVDFKTVPSTAPYTLTIGSVPTKIPVVVMGDNWDQYCVFAERIEDLDGVGRPLLLTGKLGTDYTMVGNADGTATITFAAKYAGHRVKILYSTLPELSYTNPFTLGPYQYNGTIVNSKVSYTFGPYTKTWTDKIGVTHKITMTDSINAYNKTTGTLAYLEDYEEPWYCGTLKVPAGETKYFLYTGHDHTHYEAEDSNIKFDGIVWAGWEITAPSNGDLEITIHSELGLHHNVTYDPVKQTLNITAWYEWEYLSLSEKIMGRYEWVVVGNHSRAIDSIGAAMVSETFDSVKQMEMGIGGLDISDPKWGPRVPYLLMNLGKASWRAGAPAYLNWYDTRGRLALLDDWCTTWPISSSNIISVGGGPANLVSEYFNEFTDALFIYGILGLPIIDKFLPVTCWNKMNKAVGAGYAVITTYKDLNGTVGFLVYGYTGEDTYYASKWLHDGGGIQYLQGLNRGVTTLILKISYTTCPPTLSVVERLGTISEKPVHPDP